MLTLRERIEEEMKSSGGEDRKKNKWFIEDNRQEIADAIRRFDKKKIWNILWKEKKITCKYIQFCNLLNEVLPEFSRKSLSAARRREEPV